MRRPGKVALAAGLSVALFGIGGVGLFRLAEPEGAPVATGNPSLFLGPGGSATLDGTIAGLQHRLRVAPGDWQSFASLGLAYLQKGRVSADPAWYPKAEGALERSLGLNEADNFGGVLGMGVLALGRHEFAEALTWGRRAREMNPYNAQARGVIGDALLELGRYQHAADVYQDMIDLRPDLASYARVSYYRELAGDVTGAIGAMAQAVDLAGTPEDAAWSGYQLGELSFGSGRIPSE